MISRIKDYLEFHEKKDKHQSDIQFFKSLLAYVEGLEAKAALLESFEDEMRALASYVGAGGYNTELVEPKLFAGRIRWGINHLIDVQANQLEAAKKRIAELDMAQKRIAELEEDIARREGYDALLKRIDSYFS